MLVGQGKLPPRTDLLSRAFASCRGALLLVGLFSLAINLLMLTTSVYMMQVFDRVLVSGSLETLVYLTLIATGALLVLSLLEATRGLALVRISTWLERRLAPSALARMVDGMLARQGERADALRDLGSVRGFLGGTGILSLLDAPWVPVYLAVIYLMHPLLGHAALAGAVVLFGLALVNDLLTRACLREANVSARRAAREADAAMRNADVIDAMSLQEGVVGRWARDGAVALRLHARASDRGTFVASVSRFFRLFVQIAVLGLGAWLVVRQELTGGAMIAASIVMGRALAPVEQAIGSWKQALHALEAKRRLASFFGRPERRPEGMALPAPTGRLRVEGAVFGFAAGRPPVLKGVSLTVEPGEALAVVGPSAAGKSTLARLLAGIEPCTAGTVRLDGADIFTWPRADLGRYLGYLPQDVELFSGTVAENIARLGRIDPDAVVEAARLARCHEMILQLEKGYETELGESGARLSGGQRQRIALARALHGKPKLIILDEPNASLDAEGEAALNQAIAAMKIQGAAVVVIGHRPSMLAAVDRILVLVGGKVERIGPRAEVLAALRARAIHPVPRGASAAVPAAPPAAPPAAHPAE